MKHWYIFFVTIICISCNIAWPDRLLVITQIGASKKNSTIIQPQFLRSIRSGDLLFRTSNDLISGFFRKFNQNHQDFSHLGIAVIENNEVFVLHILQNDKNPTAAMRKEPLASFWNKDECTKLGKATLNFTKQELQQFLHHADSLNKLPISFDHDIELNNGNALYCTEYVAQCINAVSNTNLQVPHTIIDDKKGYTPDNFYNNHICTNISIYNNQDQRIFLNN